jgi:hypothetical protein
MSNLEQVQQLMDKMSKNKKTAKGVLRWNGATKRLEVTPASQALNSDDVPLAVEDMKVSLGTGPSGLNQQNPYDQEDAYDHRRWCGHCGSGRASGS